MKRYTLPFAPLLLAPLLLTGACSAEVEPEPVANQFEAQAGAIENKARALEALVANETAAFERQVEAETNAVLARNVTVEIENVGEANTQ